MHSTGSHWPISHTLPSRRELLSSGTGAVFGVCLEIYIRSVTLVLPTKLPEKKAELQTPNLQAEGLWSPIRPFNQTHRHPNWLMTRSTL